MRNNFKMYLSFYLPKRKRAVLNYLRIKDKCMCKTGIGALTLFNGWPGAFYSVYSRDAWVKDF